MLILTIPAQKLWDSKKEEFIYTKATTLSLEHSLVSISKWEAKYHKPFISDDKKTMVETLDYIKDMTITQNVDPLIYNSFTPDNFEAVSKYIDNKMTATWFREPKEGESKSPTRKEVITSELIYYWMIALEIPFECQKWHLNRLLTLIKVCNVKASNANKKQSKREILKSNSELNAARRKKLSTNG